MLKVAADIICPRCGHANEGVASFSSDPSSEFECAPCNNCGTKLNFYGQLHIEEDFFKKNKETKMSPGMFQCMRCGQAYSFAHDCPIPDPDEQKFANQIGPMPWDLQIAAMIYAAQWQDGSFAQAAAVKYARELIKEWEKQK